MRLYNLSVCFKMKVIFIKWDEHNKQMTKRNAISGSVWRLTEFVFSDNRMKVFIFVFGNGINMFDVSLYLRIILHRSERLCAFIILALRVYMCVWQFVGSVKPCRSGQTSKLVVLIVFGSIFFQKNLSEHIHILPKSLIYWTSTLFWVYSLVAYICFLLFQLDERTEAHHRQQFKDVQRLRALKSFGMLCSVSKNLICDDVNKVQHQQLQITV